MFRPTIVHDATKTKYYVVSEVRPSTKETLLETEETGYFQLFGGPGDGLIINNEPITVQEKPSVFINYMWKPPENRGVLGTTYYRYRRTDEFVNGVRLYKFIEPWTPK